MVVSDHGNRAGVIGAIAAAAFAVVVGGIRIEAGAAVAGIAFARFRFAGFRFFERFGFFASAFTRRKLPGTSACRFDTQSAPACCCAPFAYCCPPRFPKPLPLLRFQGSLLPGFALDAL